MGSRKFEISLGFHKGTYYLADYLTTGWGSGNRTPKKPHPREKSAQIK
jgi:hypothetical protein